MRLIDADLLLKDMKEDPLFLLVERYNMTGKIETQPTVDAVSKEKYEASEEARDILVKFADDLLAELKERVEVISCQECKHRDKCHKTIAIREYDKDIECSYARFEKLTFCSYGKRREE